MTTKKLPDGFCENPNLHAYLYVSSDKTQRNEVALEIAKSLLCTERNDNAHGCGKCSDCIKIASKTHPDCLVYGKDGEKVLVDDIRENSSMAYIAPNEAKGKVFVLQEADTYIEQSQNALLKILEEPPKNVYFVLTAASKGALLSTVRSRVCIVTGQEKSLEDIKKEVSKLFPGLSDKAMKRVSFFAYSYDEVVLDKIESAVIDTAFDVCIEFLKGTGDGIDPTKLPMKKEELSIYLRVFMLCTFFVLKTKMMGKISQSALSDEEISLLCARVSAKRAITLYERYENALVRLANSANENALIATLI